MEACNLAIENMDFRLSLLISQSSGGNDLVRTMIRKQLKEWSNSDVRRRKLGLIDSPGFLILIFKNFILYVLFNNI